MAKTGTQIAPTRTFRALSADPFRELFDLQRGINQLFNASISARARSHSSPGAWHCMYTA